MKITRSKPFAWDAKKEKRVVDTLCKFAREAKPTGDAFIAIAAELGCTVAIARNHWYGTLRAQFIKQYERSQALAGVKSEVRAQLSVEKTEKPVQQEMVLEVKTPETPKTVEVPVEEPKAVQEDFLPTDMMDALKGNTAALNAIAYLVNKTAKMDAKIVDLKRVCREKDQTIRDQKNELIVKTSTIESLEKKLDNVKRVYKGR